MTETKELLPGIVALRTSVKPHGFLLTTQPEGHVPGLAKRDRVMSLISESNELSIRAEPEFTTALSKALDAVGVKYSPNTSSSDMRVKVDDATDGVTTSKLFEAALEAASKALNKSGVKL